MDPKSDEGIFLGYFTNNSAYRVYNNRPKIIMEYINVVVDYSLSDEVSEEWEEEVTSQEHNVTPDVPNKGADIIYTLED